ncbi:frizzled-6-like [Amphiura filiformis]|uniref:frizzled-6-like n=1 Tax=Amphiura filiformis TaxID=82378 RepID=UPI003B214692
METRCNPVVNFASLLSPAILCLALISTCAGQKAVIYSPSPCDIKCEEITDPLCHFATYTYTGFPNLLGHTSQGYIQQYDHLIQVLDHCYNQSMEFLCGVLTPHCVEDHGLMLPARKMCEDFHKGCDEFLEEAGSFLIDCKDLPEEPDAPAVCIHFPTQAPGPIPDIVTEAPYKCNGAVSSYSMLLLLSSFIVLTFQYFLGNRL